MTKKLSNYLDYQKYFDTNALWEKVSAVARKAGVKAIYAVLLLFYSATDSTVSSTDKAKIYGALGYFILPLDLIPDPTPIMGFSDDMAALMWALKAVWDNITPEIHAKARAKLTEWFGEVKESDLKIM